MTIESQEQNVSEFNNNNEPESNNEVVLNIDLTHANDVIPVLEKPKRKKEFLMLAIIIAVLLIVGTVLTIFTIRFAAEIKEKGGFQVAEDKNTGKNTERPNKDKSKEDNKNKKDGPSASEDNSALNTITAFVDDVTYSYNSEQWDLYQEDTNGTIAFSINYPIIEGLPNKTVQDLINKEIEKTAMKSRDMMYPEISDSLKDIIDSNSYLLESEVDFKISYMDENIISIVFEDYYFLGSVYAEFIDLRTLTFNLKTGEEYKLPEILDISKDFIKEFRPRMIAESDRDSVFEDEIIFSDESLIKILNGEVLDGRYSSNFFLSAKGIDIGITYRYRSSDDNIIQRGYTTTLFSYAEIAKYALPNSIWNMIQSNNNLSKSNT